MSSYRSLSSLSPTYYDPEAEPLPEPEPAPEAEKAEPKRRGRKPGSKNKPKMQEQKKRSIPWYRIIRTMVWWAVAIVSVGSLYLGMQGWLGQSAAYITLSVSILVAALLLDRDAKKMRAS